MHAAEEAAYLMECARYLDYSGVIHGDQERIAASRYLGMMVRTLLDHAQRRKMCSGFAGKAAEDEAP